VRTWLEKHPIAAAGVQGGFTGVLVRLLDVGLEPRRHWALWGWATREPT
jgi:hypothetical protein